MRIVLANPRGFCAGVDRAIDIVERALELFEDGQFGAALQVLTQMPGWTDQTNHRATPSLKLMKRAVGCLESPPEPFGATIE